MSATSDLFTIVKKLFLVAEDMTRLSSEVKELAHRVADHGERLAALEAVQGMPRRGHRRLVLPGDAER